MVMVTMPVRGTKIDRTSFDDRRRTVGNAWPQVVVKSCRRGNVSSHPSVTLKQMGYQIPRGGILSCAIKKRTAPRGTGNEALSAILTRMLLLIPFDSPLDLEMGGFIPTWS